MNACDEELFLCLSYEEVAVAPTPEAPTIQEIIQEQISLFQNIIILLFLAKILKNIREKLKD